MTFQNELLNRLKQGGDKIALNAADTQWSYTELMARANAITTVLIKNGVKKEVPVGIMLSDTTQMIAAIIGVANAGGIFVPMDATLPAQRLDHVKTELNLEHVITDGKTDLGVSNEYAISDLLSHSTAEIPNVEWDAEDSLYVYFTSGSTGTPKGIVGKNASLLQFIQWEINEFGIESNENCSQFISPFFDAFLRDVFVALFANATLCIPPAKDDFFTPENIGTWIEENEITHIHCVPSVFALINNQNLSEKSYPELKRVLMSGEKIHPADMKRWFDKVGERVTLVNLYGTTETTMIRSFHKITPADATKNRIAVGKPIADTEILVLNDDLKACPPLMTGDVYIASPFLTKGYLNRPELTKEKFVTINDKAAFKTGDKGRLLPGGILDLVGRDDRQVKIRGIRVEMDEVEFHLKSVSEAEAVAVILKDGETEDDRQLVGYIQSQKDNGVEEAKIIEGLRAIVPSYMVPSQLFILTELPRLSNGKLDLKSLENYTPVEEETFAPQNELEEQLLNIWNEVLPGKSISVKDNFLKIGGNSLSVMRLIGKIFKEFDVRIALSDVFKNLTIEDQAKLIQGLKKDTNVQINKAAVKEAYHLSSAQQRIYYKYTFDNNDTSFNMPMAWELNDEFDFEKTQKAFEALIKQHEPLRTSFQNSTEGPQQKIHDQVAFNLEEIEAENEGALNKAITSFIRPFALESAPLIRGGVINLDGKARLLVMDIHHIVCDGMSQMNLIQDFKSLYSGASLKELPLQYKDFAEWEFEYKKTEDYLKHREFWLQSFESELPKLPLTAKDNAAGNTAGDNYHFSINTEVYKPVLDSLKDENVTDFSGLFMLFHLYLSNFSGQTDVVIGTNSSGRIHEETQQMVGMFVKTLPIRYKLDIEVSFKENLKRLHKHILKANSDQLYDLIDIVKNLNEEGNATELFNAMFVFQNFEKPSENSGELFKHYSLNAETFKYPITLFCHEYDAQMHFRLEYSTAYFNETEIKEFADGFVTLINEVRDQLDAPLKVLLGEPKAVEEDIVSFNF